MHNDKIANTQIEKCSVAAALLLLLLVVDLQRPVQARILRQRERGLGFLLLALVDFVQQVLKSAFYVERLLRTRLATLYLVLRIRALLIHFTEPLHLVFSHLSALRVFIYEI